HTLSAGEYVYVSDDDNAPPELDLKFVSSGLISVWIGSCRQTDDVYAYNIDIIALGDDTWFAGGLGGKDFVLYIPSYAILFAPQDVKVKIDGAEQSLKADQYIRISGGPHRVVSDKVVVIQVVGLGNQMDSWAQYLVSSPEVSATVPEIGGDGGMDITLIAGAGAVAVIIVIIVAYFIMRRR
ncbi:MAG: hypothetical protein ACETV1_00010, partial [Candidatus Bathyarchaeia archaeon]